MLVDIHHFHNDFLHAMNLPTLVLFVSDKLYSFESVEIVHRPQQLLPQKEHSKPVEEAMHI
jgi:hypothetical protein